MSSILDKVLLMIERVITEQKSDVLINFLVHITTNFEF